MIMVTAISTRVRVKASRMKASAAEKTTTVKASTMESTRVKASGVETTTVKATEPASSMCEIGCNKKHQYER